MKEIKEYSFRFPSWVLTQCDQVTDKEVLSGKNSGDKKTPDDQSNKMIRTEAHGFVLKTFINKFAVDHGASQVSHGNCISQRSHHGSAVSAGINAFDTCLKGMINTDVAVGS